MSGDTDWLWVRLLDVPQALTARGWFTDGELVLDVADTPYPLALAARTWRSRA